MSKKKITARKVQLSSHQCIVSLRDMNDHVGVARSFFYNALKYCFLFVLGSSALLAGVIYTVESNYVAYFSSAFCLASGCIGCWVTFIKINRCDNDSQVILSAIARCEYFNRSFDELPVTSKLRDRFVEGLDDILSDTLEKLHQPLGSMIAIPELPFPKRLQSSVEDVNKLRLKDEPK